MGQGPSAQRRLIAALAILAAGALVDWTRVPRSSPTRSAVDPVRRAVSTGRGVAAGTATDGGDSAAPIERPDTAPTAIDVAAMVDRVHHAFLEDGDSFVAGTTWYERRLGRDGSLDLTVREPSAADGPAMEARAHLGPTELKRGSLALGSGGAVRVDGEGVAIRDGDVVERLANDATGLEQTWTLARAPRGAGDLEVVVPVRGMRHVTTNASGVHVAGEHGLGFRYGHATLIEADGDRTHVPVRFDRSAIRFEVPSALLEGANYPLVIDPTIGAEVGVDGAAPGSKLPGTSDSAIAWNGSEYFAVWVDSRASGLGPGIYGSRVTAAGAALDIGGVLVARSGTDTLAVPAIASNGPDYLVAWRSTSGSVVSVRAARVTSNLSVLDPNGISLWSSTVGTGTEPIVASDGTDYAVTWAGRFGGVLANGTVTDPGGIGGFVGGFEAMVAMGRNTYLLARTNTYVIQQTRYDMNSFGPGNWVSGTQYDFGNPNPKSGVSFACTPSDCFYAWTETVGINTQIRGGWTSSWTSSRDVSAIGTALAPSVVAVGNAFYISYVYGTSLRGIHSASFSGGPVQPSDLFSSFALAARPARLASDGTKIAVMGFTTAELGLTTGANTAVPVIPAAIRASGETTPTVAGNGAGYLVAWQDDRLPQGIYSARMAIGGTAMDSLGRFLGATTGAADQIPSVASDGTDYAVAWNASGGVVRRVDGTTGAPIDGSPVGVGVGSYARIASNGTRYFVVGSSAGSVLGRTVTSGGLVEGGGAFIVGTGTRPAVASNGTDFLVGWDSGGDIRGGRFSSAGVALDGGGFIVSSAVNAQSEPAVGSDGTNYLVAWSDLRTGAADIVAARIDPALVSPVLDTAGIVVSAANGAQTSPAVAWNGTEYLVVWNDARGVTNDIFGTRVATGGSVEDASLGTAFAVLASADERDPSLGAGLADANLLVYSRVDVEPPFLGVSRVRARALAYGSWNGSLCSDPTQCDSGFCVDGVCCATACLGGDTDCQACSVTGGAATDGVCGLVSVFQGHVCRDAAGACDAPERCSGSSVTCPPDGLLAPGTTCRASIGPCDVREACSGYELDCPADLVAPSGTACRDARGACDVAESCDGATPSCPADAFQSSGTECRASGGTCDVAEVCDGATANCPGDAMLPNGTSCRPSVGICDVTEYCTGTAACPPDGFAGNTTQCDVAHGNCDFADFCTGASSTCPETVAPDGSACDDGRGCTASDACAAGVCSGTLLPAGAVCRPALGGCDLEETCDGASDACPADAVRPVDSVCRAAVGPCDAAEICDGFGPACPGDVRLPAGAPCRTSAGACDLEEQCTGLGPSCPADVFKPVGSLCRSPATPCDATEYCTGGATCPPDDTVADGTPCSDGLACTVTSACQGGACAAAVTLDCSDGDACTTDSCAEPNGCLHAAIPACVADAGVDVGGTDAGTDAGGTDAGNVDSGPTVVIIEKGCSCRVAGGRMDGHGPHDGAVAGLLALACGIRRRRARQ